MLVRNRKPCAISGAEDPNGRDKYFIATPEGLILRRLHLTNPYTGIFVCNLETYYFYRVNGQYLASYKNKGNNFFGLALNWVSPQNNAGMEIGMSVAFREDFSKLPQTYTCAAGDTYESIASNLYGDASLASYIDAANGGGTLIAGQTIVIPQLISVHNKAGMARPYYQLLQIIQGSLTPHLDTPQPPPDDDDFFGMLFKAIVVVVICVAAPEVAPAFVTSLTATFGTAGALAVGAGLADAAAQGLCIGLGIQNNFSLAELATTMITAGFGAQLGPLAANANAAQWMEFIVKAGAVNIEEQLAEMAIGIRQQFDLAGVALAMGSAGLGNKIKIDNPLERRLVSDIAVAGMSSVVRGRFDIENLATQLITDAASYIAQQQTKKVSDEYHQSQQASRGAGHITQTTIEQQWESQLINDAKFTANTPLPSVTFDVNDDYISQQLGQRVGEEISHFQHQTPARNSNGFWRGVDDVLKMQEGTRKFADLIFTGQYEAPQDSWERAGFLIGAPIGLSLGAERLGAEAIETLYQGSQQLGKGLMQASRLMNRWGFWNRAENQNIVDPAEKAFYSKAKLISEHDFYHPGSIQNKFSASFSGYRYKTYQLKEDFVFYRAGSNDDSIGRFFSFDKPISELQIRIDKAVRPVWPDGGNSVVNTGYAIKIPKGSVVHVGNVAQQGDIFLGGTRQIYIDNPWLIPGVKIVNEYRLQEELLFNLIAKKNMANNF